MKTTCQTSITSPGPIECSNLHPYQPWENMIVDMDGVIYNEQGHIVGHGEFREGVFYGSQKTPVIMSDPGDEQPGHRLLN